MSGRIIVIALAVLVLIFGAALWYFQTHAYYRRVDGLLSVDVGGRAVPVVGYRGIDAATSPNKLRGCFTVDPGAFDGVPLAENPAPLIAPAWFDCFDAAALTADLDAGRAIAYMAGDETPAAAEGYEIKRMIAVYPDGRAYLWRHYRED